jgi:hypothetical protein
MSGEQHHIQYVPEPPGVRMAFVGWSALGALVLLVAAIGFFLFIFHAVVPGRPPRAPRAFPEPRVNTTEREELQRLIEAQQGKLEAWRWVDSQHSTVQVPIERAMQLLVKKGADAYQPLLTSPQSLSAPTAAAERATTRQGAPPSGALDHAIQSTPEPNK